VERHYFVQQIATTDQSCSGVRDLAGASQVDGGGIGAGTSPGMLHSQGLIQTLSF
jgi:hypothetical protein